MLLSFFRECNLRLAVIDVLNEYYVCLMCEFHRIWKTQSRTIADSGNVLKGKLNAGHVADPTSTWTGMVGTLATLL